MKIRFAVPGDSAGLLKIYAQYMDTPVTFEYDLPSVEEFSKRIAEIMETYPYLVCETDGEIIGFAYAHRHKEREAYQWNAELSVYLDKSHTSKGLGRRLYGMLIEILKFQGVQTVYGVVAIPNERSEKLHMSMGFRKAGIYHKTGYKGGQWHDVALFEKKIGACCTEPSPVVPLNKVAKEKLEKLEEYLDA